VTPPLPDGFTVELDPWTRQLSDGTLFGGTPARAMRLTPAGDSALAQLRSGPVATPGAAILGRVLTDAGLAHPVPPAGTSELAGEVTVIIPVRDRAAQLDRCLAALGTGQPVIVVDDGSADPAAIADVAARHGAQLRRHDENAGPAAARNTGLAGADTDLVAFVDSDCAAPPGWIAALAGHLADPAVGAVAPRITAPGGAAAADRYALACGSLDLGDRPARVIPGGRVSYVPTAALLVRRAALKDAALPGGDVFDPALRFGEDVDLIWRLHRAGWRIRYEPAVQVRHDNPAGWAAMLERRFRYGTSAAPLACRHPGSLAPLVLQPWPAAAAAALLARRPAAAAAAGVISWLDLTSRVRAHGIPADGAPAATLTAIRQTWLGIGRYATQFAAPLLAAALVAPGGASRKRRWGRRAAAASLLLGPAVASYAERKPGLNPVAFTLARIADDACYGAGVWAGCARERTLAPVRPAIAWQPLRMGSEPDQRSDS
jgi:mycofactocin system glycosyltransferase